MSKKRKFSTASEALAFLATSRDLEITAQYKTIKIKNPVGLRYLAAIDFLTVKTKDHDYGWSYN